MEMRFFNRNLAGGALLDIGVYALSFIRWFMDSKPDQLLSQMKAAPTGVDEQAGLEATKQDITSNPKNVEIVEMEAAQLPRALADVDFAVINGNYAVAAEIADRVLVTEDKDSEAAKQYANIVAVREGDENREDIKALVEALQSDEVKAYIEETFGSTVIPVF